MRPTHVSPVTHLRTILQWATVLAVVSAGILALSNSAYADHNKGAYGQHGYTWFATLEDQAIAWVTSDWCNGRELEAYDRTRVSTEGAFPNKWPSGIRLSRHDTHACDGQVTASVDIELEYVPNLVRDDGSEYGGVNFSTLAPESWCDIWNTNYPCGYHPSLVKLNMKRFGSSGYSDHYRRRLIMHEIGHSLGLAHHCSSDSIMNDGTSGCNGGAWTNINGYQGTDHDGIRDIFPNWKYS